MKHGDASYTIAQDGRHAVEVTSDDPGVVAHWRLFPPKGGRKTFLLNLNATRAAENTYMLHIEIQTPSWSFRRAPEGLIVGFHAYDDGDARTVLHSMAAAWARGRIPVAPDTKLHTSAWITYLDMVADAVAHRHRKRGIRVD